MEEWGEKVNLAQVSSQMNLEILNDEIVGWEQIEVKGGFSTDLLSVVISESQPGQLWITRQVHMNIVAVALLAELAGIILCAGKKPDRDTLEKAAQEKIPIFSTDDCAFETAGKLYILLTNKGSI